MSGATENKTAAAKREAAERKTAEEQTDTREPQGGPEMEQAEAKKHREARAGNIEFTYKNKPETETETKTQTEHKTQEK